MEVILECVINGWVDFPRLDYDDDVCGFMIRVNNIYIQFILKYYVNIHVDYKYYKKSKLVVEKTKLGI